MAQQQTIRPKNVVNFLASSLIALIALGEDLFTTFFFDEKYDFYIVALTMFAFTIFAAILKSIVFCSKPKWDDTVVEILNEALQAVLFLIFCDFSSESIIALSIMGGVQIFLTIVIACNQEDSAYTPDQDSFCEKFVIKFLVPVVVAFLASAFPIAFLFTQSESPFHDKIFEGFLAAYLWLLQTMFQGSFDELLARLEILDGSEDPFRKAYLPVLQWVSVAAFVVMQVAVVVLSSLWLFSPELERTYDEVLCWVNIVVAAVCLLCGGGCCLKSCLECLG